MTFTIVGPFTLATPERKGPRRTVAWSDPSDPRVVVQTSELPKVARFSGTEGGASLNIQIEIDVGDEKAGEPYVGVRSLTICTTDGPLLTTSQLRRLGLTGLVETAVRECAWLGRPGRSAQPTREQARKLTIRRPRRRGQPSPTRQSKLHRTRAAVLAAKAANPPRPTGRAVAIELEVSEQTARKYIEAMYDAGLHPAPKRKNAKRRAVARSDD